MLAAPRVLQPGHATQFVNKILSDDSLVEAINSGQKDPRDISVPVSVLQLLVDICKLHVINYIELRMLNQNPYTCIKVLISAIADALLLGATRAFPNIRMEKMCSTWFNRYLVGLPSLWPSQ